MPNWCAQDKAEFDPPDHIRSRSDTEQEASLEMSVVQLIGTYARVPVRMMLHPSRCKSDIADARQLAMYLLHVTAGRNMAEIGAFFGRDRTTVSHACGRVEDRRDSVEFDRIVTGLEGAVDLIAANFNIPEQDEDEKGPKHDGN